MELPKCVNVKCNKYALYNNPGSAIKLYCKDHKTEGMIDLTVKRCEQCKLNASYNYPGESEKRLCYVHKLPDMVMINTNKCEECNKIPRFGYTYKKTHCAEHKKPGMVNLTIAHCARSGCNKSPCFNFAEESKAIYCAIHKLPMMVDIKNNKCEECGVTAGYNYPGYKKGRFCAKHKFPTMVSIKFVKCVECNNQAHYAMPPDDNGKRNNKRPTHCINHKLPGMINKETIKQQCREPNCKKKASYNYITESEYLYCAEHKLPGMLDINNKRCKFKGCLRRPTFANKGQKKRLYCESHKLPGMVNVNAGACIHASCELIASFDYPKTKRPRYCATHALPYMERIHKYKPEKHDERNYTVTIERIKDDIHEICQLDSIRLYNYLISSYETKNTKFIIYHTKDEPKKELVDPFAMYPLIEEDNETIISISDQVFGTKLGAKLDAEFGTKLGAKLGAKLGISNNQQDYIEPWNGIIKVVVYIDNIDAVYMTKRDLVGNYRESEISEDILLDATKCHSQDIVITINMGSNKKRCPRYSTTDSKLYKLYQKINDQLGLILTKYNIFGLDEKREIIRMNY